MKRTIFCRSATICLLLFLFPGSGFGDVIYLKNGRSLEGVVEKEDADAVILNIGAGTTTLYKSEIARIKRDSSEERKELEAQWAAKYFSHPEFTPQRFQDLAAAFRQLEKSRASGLRSNRQRDELVLRIAQREDEIKQLREEIEPYNEQLGQMDPQADIKSYNETVSKYNTLANQIQQKTQETADFQTQLSDMDKQIAAYSDDFNTVNHQFRQALTTPATGWTDQEKLFLQIMRQELEKMGKDFTAVLVEYHQDLKGIMVDVLLNDTLSAEFVVDTGATLVVLAEHIADRLGLAIDQEKDQIPVTLGDGRKVDACPVILKSVKVGDAKVRNVRAAVMIDAALDIDGLLGMSFLENFALKIDGKNKKLILEELSP